MDPLNKAELETLREEVHRQFNNNHVSWISLSTIGVMRLLELLDRTELARKNLEEHLDRIHHSIGYRAPHGDPRITADCVIDWIAEAKSDTPPLL